MHLHAYFMRTTIDLPDDIRKKCIHIATERNLNGFSEVIIEALESYFRTSDSHRKETITRLKGSLSKKEARESMKIIQESRNNWCQT